MESVMGAALAMMVMMLVEGAMAAQLMVGGSQGWDESTDFNSWASSETFKVGDQLVFKYAQGLHSVVELADESAYKSCDTGTAVNSMSSGNDVVKLTKPGTRYFGCGTPGHCGQGMKLKVNVAAGSAPSTPASQSSSPTTTSGAAPSFRAWSPLFLLVAAVITLFVLDYSSMC
ncbi:hypothetical protein CRG98_019289 [Punica granatum]|nr:hypothetical protein CRG98_019289 [Punica granatum]